MEQRLQSSNGEPARHREVRFTGQVGRTHRDSSLNAWMEPYQTHAAKPLFHGDTNQWKVQAVKRVGGISDLHCVSGECS